jgi:succinate dehydrogenase / fumarate reductase flavoprotein subunit
MAEQANFFTTDVLVVGGGIAAMFAANKAADQGASVIIADKSTASWSGQMPLSGGGFACVPADKVDMQVKYYVTEGEYLNDQPFTEAVVKALYPCAEEVAQWGIYSFDKDLDGKLKLRAGGSVSFPHREYAMPMMLDRALHKGAKVLNKVYIVDLIKHNGRVAGAVGFHYQTGDFYVIQAKSVILACGGCMFKTRGLWHTNCGEGVAMAYEAGAEMRNAEFGNMFNISNKYTLDDAGGHIGAARRFAQNALGETLLEKYPEINAPKDILPPWAMAGGSSARVIRAWLKEIEEGRGPIYLDLTTPEARQKMPMMFETGGQRRGALHHGYANKLKRLGVDITKEKVEWKIVAEFHEGPIRVDLNCESTVPGVYAVGDIMWHGSAYFGAVDWHIGIPQGLAMVTGFWAGTAAGKAAASLPEPEFSSSEVERLRKELFAPLDVKEGYNPYDAIKDIQEVVFKVKNSFAKSKDRLEKALDQIEEIRAKFPTLTAKDSHELVRCHEAKAMATCAEILYRPSLMRTETRGSNIREDYPKRDDKNWLKWVIAKKESGKMKLWTEPVPIERYKYKPG